MYLPTSRCIICGEAIDKIKYNLKTTHSEKSKTLLIKLVEKFYSNILFLHCNICTNCHDLLNELDYVQCREQDIYKKLKSFVKQWENVDKTANEVKIDLSGLPIRVKRVSSTFKPPASPPPKVEENERAFEQIQSSIQMDLTKHIEEFMNKSKPSRNVLCEICGQNFKTKSGYESHMKKHDKVEDGIKLLALNKQEDQTYYCQYCGKHFIQKSALGRHLPIHTGETRYQCDECGKKFLHRSSFTMHKKIHLNQRNYRCETCKHCFLTKSHLNRHLRSTHEKEWLHSCDYCGKQFSDKFNLSDHIKSIHKLDELEGFQHEHEMEQVVLVQEIEGEFVL